MPLLYRDSLQYFWAGWALSGYAVVRGERLGFNSRQLAKQCDAQRSLRSSKDALQACKSTSGLLLDMHWLSRDSQVEPAGICVENLYICRSAERQANCTMGRELFPLGSMADFRVGAKCM